MDTCCGSSVSVEESAHREGADPAEVCEALRTAVQN
jgi:iron-sulfur cluster repair protein YtfE (RIC family)